jgi:hypothetical protein
MKDLLQEHLKKLRAQVGECEASRNSATDEEQRKLFSRLAAHYKVLAVELERVIDGYASPDTFLGRKTYEPFPNEDDE